MSKKYSGEVTTKRTDKAAGTEWREILAVFSFDGPETQAEYDTWQAAEFAVSADILIPPVRIPDKGDAVIPADSRKPMAPYMVKNFDAWKYGAGLLANGPARREAEQGVVKDHVINFQGKTTDLDTLAPDILVNAINRLASLAGLSIDIGTGNIAKINHKVDEMVKAGTHVYDANSQTLAIVKGKNGGVKK